MPSIKDDSTVEAIAQVFCGEGKRNKAETLRIVGYAPSTAVSGMNREKIYENTRVKAAIARIDAKTRCKSIKNREQRQEFWTDVMDTAPNMNDRLRASELLGKSEADFVTTILTTPVSAPALDPAEQEFLADASKAYKERMSRVKLSTDKEIA